MTDIPRRRWFLIRLLVVGAIALLWWVTICIAFVLGAVFEDVQVYHRQYTRTWEDFRPVLATNEAFRSLEVDETSLGELELSGNVPSEEIKQDLYEHLKDLFGTKRADRIIRLVDVKDAQ